MSYREIKSFDPKWALIGLAAAVVAAAGIYASSVLGEPAAGPQVLTPSHPVQLVTGFDNGPVPGMPEGTFDELTGNEFEVTGLDNGPVPGMPEGTYRGLTGANSVLDGPVPGMPEGTYQQIRELGIS